MVSYLVKFSAVIGPVGVSFALAFYALLHRCNNGNDEDSESEGAFRSFGSSILMVLEVALGDVNFGEFIEIEYNCNRPHWVTDAAIFIMVVYIFIMAILLMNLIIAVLSTAHMEVHGNAEKEFYLARSKLIQDSAKAVVSGSLPPPLNIVTEVPGFVIEGVDEIASLFGSFLGDRR